MQVSLYFNTKMPGKRVSKNIIQLVYFNYYEGKSAKEIADLLSLKIKTVDNIISRAEKEGRLDLKESTGLRVSHETIRNVLENHKYSSRVARKKSLLSAQNAEKSLRFATEHVSLPPEYWVDDDAVLS